PPLARQSGQTDASPEGPAQSPSGGTFLMAVLEMLRQDMAEAAQASENRIRTDIGGLRSDMREGWSREQYLTEQIAALMPRAKRQSVIDDLHSSIAQWSDLPASAKDQLTAAAYLSGDPVLNTAEAVSSIVLAVGKAVEVTGKELLRKGSGFRLRYLIETLETDPNTRPWVGTSMN
ncbi:MAG: hypothetical protein KGK07_16645, partial [Chloroflexota bacterium]|nr:hypothetical protein [Chloroflexota bacterium]